MLLGDTKFYRALYPYGMRIEKQLTLLQIFCPVNFWRKPYSERITLKRITVLHPQQQIYP